MRAPKARTRTRTASPWWATPNRRRCQRRCQLPLAGLSAAAGQHHRTEGEGHDSEATDTRRRMGEGHGKPVRAEAIGPDTCYGSSAGRLGRQKSYQAGEARRPPSAEHPDERALGTQSGSVGGPRRVDICRQSPVEQRDRASNTRGRVSQRLSSVRTDMSRSDHGNQHGSSQVLGWERRRDTELQRRSAVSATRGRLAPTPPIEARAVPSASTYLHSRPGRDSGAQTRTDHSPR